MSEVTNGTKTYTYANKKYQSAIISASKGNNPPMNTFLVVTIYNRFTNEGSTVEDAFREYAPHTISTDPYSVTVTTHLTIDDFAREMNRLDVKCQVTELGRSVEVKGVGLP
jgi:hypothetical protein